MEPLYLVDMDKGAISPAENYKSRNERVVQSESKGAIKGGGYWCYWRYLYSEWQHYKGEVQA